MKWTLLFLFLFIGCNSAVPQMSSISGSSTTPTFTGNFKAIVSGLGTSPVKVSINGESELTASQNGEFPFPSAIANSSEYHAKITQQPTDGISCAIVNPMGELSGAALAIEVKCDSSTKIFVKGLISGNFTGPLKLKVGQEIIEVPEGASSYFFPNSIETSSFPGVQVVSPSNQCTFANGLPYNSGLQDSGRFDLWCNTLADGVNYNIKLTVTGLTSPETITLGSNFASNLITSNTSQKLLLSTAKNDKRYVLEILDAPSTRRCYISNSSNKDHFYAFSPPKYDVQVEIKCDTRATSSCEALSTELPAVNGKLHDVTCASGFIYYGGSFTTIGRQYGIVPLSVSASSFTFSTKVFDRIHGKVNKIISDGKTGYFVAGLFQRVGDENKLNLVHMNSDFTVDTNFRSGTNGEIKDVIFKDNELFLFGNFTKVYQDAESYDRTGFAKISLATVPEKVSNLSIPGLTPLNNVSASLVDWNLYFHAEVITAGSSITVSYIVNKNSGSVKAIKTFSSELGNTLYWKEAASGKVWMINTGLGLVDPETLSRHPLETTAEGIVRKNRLYTLASSGLLFQSGPAIVEVTNLSNLATSSTTNFGLLSSVPKNIVNAGIGFTINDGNTTCFKQRDGTDGIHYDGSTSVKKGLACFDSSGSMLGFGLSSNPQGSFVFSGNGKAILNSQFFDFKEINALALIDNLGQVSTEDAHFPLGSSVYALESDGTSAYIGGDFPYLPTCSLCQRLAKSTPGITMIDSNWFSSPITSGAVTKLSYSSPNLFMATTFNFNTFYALNLANPSDLSALSRGTPILDLKSVKNTMMLTEYQRHVFLKPDYANGGFTEPSLPVQAYGPLAVLGGHFIASGLDSSLRFFNDLGAFEYEIPIPEFSPSSLKLTTAESSICTYDGKTGVACFNESLQGTLNGSPNIVDVNFSLFKGIKNYVILAKENSAPVVLVPRTGP